LQVIAARGGDVDVLAFAAALEGRGVHPSTSQLILSRLCHCNLVTAQHIPQKGLMLSRKVDECKPLLEGAAAAAALGAPRWVSVGGGGGGGKVGLSPTPLSLPWAFCSPGLHRYGGPQTEEPFKRVREGVVTLPGGGGGGDLGWGAEHRIQGVMDAARFSNMGHM
jgi:hypothetical protein